MEQFFITLLNNSITAGYLVLAILLLRSVLYKAPKFIRCILWGFVGLRLLLPYSIESIFSLIPSSQPIPADILHAPAPSIQTGIPYLNNTVNPILSDSMAATPQNSVNPMQIAGNIAAWIWLTGMVIMALYGIFSFLRLRKSLGEAVLQEDNIWVSDRISSPFLLGIFRPRIYLPAELAEDDRLYVIAHEKAHLRRKDHWWKPLGYILLTVYWFNPLIWTAYVFLCRDIEFACDEKVIKELGSDCKKAYSTALINCSIPRRMISACPVAFGEGGIKKRIQSVLNYKKPAFWIILIAIVACIVVAVCFLTNPKEPNTPDTPTIETYSFHATVLEVHEDSLLVRPMEGEPEFKASDKITIKLPKDNANTFSVGDWVDITYDGIIQELYPAIIPNVISVNNITFLSSYTAPYAEKHMKYAAFDIDNDGIIEDCCIDQGLTSYRHSIFLSIYENGLLEYHFLIVPEDQSLFLSFSTSDSGEVSIIAKSNQLSNASAVCNITIKDKTLRIQSEDSKIDCIGFIGAPCLYSIKQDYPQYLSLSTAKGLVVYVWNNGDWRCGVRSGTNREATMEELWAFGDGVTLLEMAIILGSYRIPSSDIHISYQYNPAFSGSNPTPPTLEEQEYIETQLFANLPSSLTDISYHTADYDPLKTYPIIIYAYQLAKGAWCYEIYKDTTIVATAKDAVMTPRLGFGADSVKKELEKYDLEVQEIPVILTNHVCSSYFYVFSEELLLEAREQIGL